ncbi:MAG: HigA family addiction module antidote protein [Victivallales bacterium]|nr:HigA family addiction module antidote protein [Victivallales bacterium]
MSNTVHNENIEFYRNIAAVHPGYHIQAIADELGMSQKELAARLGITEKTMSCLLHEKAQMTPDIAERLYAVFGISAQTWMNMQTSYILHMHQIDELKRIDAQMDILRKIEYGYFEKLENSKSKGGFRKQIQNLCNWLQIANLQMLLTPQAFANFRTATKNTTEVNSLNTCAWLCYAQAKARSIQTEEFSLKKLKNAIQALKDLMLMPLGSAMEDAKRILAECGVVFLFLPYMKNTNVNGAVTWFTPKKAALIINDWRKSADCFWFTFFHEIGHVLQQKHKMMLVSYHIPEEKELENDANNFANSLLMPDYDSFVSVKRNFAEIRDKALELKILPGILAGRMARDGFITHSLAKMFTTKIAL